MMSDKLRILYIDDSELDRELVKDALEKEHGGFEVTEASDKQEFEALLKTREFDVVLSDFNIAGFEGLQVLEAVQTYDPDIPVIIVTGTGSEEIAVMALKRGAADYVIKRPKHIRRLPQTILAAIEKQALRDQRRKAEISLKESEKRYRSLFDNMLNGYCYCRMLFDRNKPQDFIYLDVNGAFETTTGLKNVVGKRISEVIPGIREADPELFEICGRVALTGIPEIFEIYLEALSMWFSISVYSPEKKHFVAVFEVITERKQAEEKLRESEERFRAIATNTPDHILIQDKDLRYVSVLNPQLGLTEKDMIGKTDFDFLPKEDAAVLTEIKKRVLGTGNPEFVKVPLASLKGDVQHFEGSYIPKRDREGKIDGLIGYFRNVTDRVKGEEALKQSEERYRIILENLLVGVYQVTLDGKFIFANQIMTEMLGYSSFEELEAIGGIAELYVRPEERQKVIDEIISKRFINKEVELRHKDGQSIWVKLHARKKQNKEGVLVLEGLIEDVTELKKLEEQLRQRQKMEAIGTLAGGVAHDFNNILTTIIGNADLALIEVGKDGNLREEIKEIKIAGERATVLTRQLLAFSRKQIIQSKVVDINELLSGMEKMLGRLIGEDVELLTILEPALWQVEADPGQIEQVIMNLTINARDAMPMGGKLTVKTANVNLDEDYFHEHGIKDQPGSYVVISVSDTGSGMDKETQEHMFEPFYTTKEQGTGLGLATVYGIVKQNNGFVWVYSEPGQGTAFKVYLPRVEGDAEPEVKERAPVDDLRGTETILIVEDNDSLRKLARTVLKKNGYKVLAAENGEDALRICMVHKGPIDLTVTDVVMPKMSGKETAERLQPLYPKMKIIYMSGYTDNAIVHHGVLTPGLNFLEKPFTPNGLARKIREVLDKKQD